MVSSTGFRSSGRSGGILVGDIGVRWNSPHESVRSEMGNAFSCARSEGKRLHSPRSLVAIQKNRQVPQASILGRLRCWKGLGRSSKRLTRNAPSAIRIDLIRSGSDSEFVCVQFFSLSRQTAFAPSLPPCKHLLARNNIGIRLVV